MPGIAAAADRDVGAALAGHQLLASLQSGGNPRAGGGRVGGGPCTRAGARSVHKAFRHVETLFVQGRNLVPSLER